MSVGGVSSGVSPSTTFGGAGPTTKGDFNAAMLEALLRGRAPEQDDGAAGLAKALTDFKKEASKTIAERAKDQILKKHNMTEEQFEALPPGQKLEIDQEIADRVQLLMGTDGKKRSRQDNDQQTAAKAEPDAAATTDSVERQRDAASQVASQFIGLPHPLAPGSSVGPARLTGSSVFDDPGTPSADGASIASSASR